MEDKFRKISWPMGFNTRSFIVDETRLLLLLKFSTKLKNFLPADKQRTDAHREHTCYLLLQP